MPLAAKGVCVGGDFDRKSGRRSRGRANPGYSFRCIQLRILLIVLKLFGWKCCFLSLFFSLICVHLRNLRINNLFRFCHPQITPIYADGCRRSVGFVLFVSPPFQPDSVCLGVLRQCLLTEQARSQSRTSPTFMNGSVLRLKARWKMRQHDKNRNFQLINTQILKAHPCPNPSRH
jgi:hypothetical protein